MFINIVTAVTITFMVAVTAIIINYILTTNPDARCAITSIVGAVACPERHSLGNILYPSSSCAWYATVRDFYCPIEDWKMFGV